VRRGIFAVNALLVAAVGWLPCLDVACSARARRRLSPSLGTVYVPADLAVGAPVQACRTALGKGQAMTVKESYAHAVEELGRVTARLDEAQIDAFIAAVAKARRVFCIGVGREGLATRAFTMRLMHLGKPAFWIWDDTTPAIGPGDLLLATSGSGCIGHIDYVFDQAVAAGADTAVVTGDPGGATARKAGTLLWLAASVYKGKADVVASSQPMGNLFEQALFILYDQIVIALAERLGVSKPEMAARHRNVE